MTARIARLRRLIPAIERELSAQLETEAQKLVAQMRAIAPRGATGALARSIGWTWGQAPKGTIAVGQVRGRSVARMAITIYAGGGDAFYARFHEFGTVKMAPAPFFYPTYRMNKRRIRAALSRAVTRAIKQT